MLAEGRWCDLDLDPCLSYRQLVRTALGVKRKNTLAFRIRTTRGRRPLLDVEAKERNIYEEIGHYSANTWNMEENPPCKRRRQHTRRTRRH